MIDPFSEANRHAALMREVYDAYRREGFSKREAMELLKALMGKPA